MNRVGLRVPILNTLALLPDGIRRRVEGAEWLTGVDPVFAGLHGFTDIGDGRSYRNEGHVVYPDHQARPLSDRVTTVVMPKSYGPLDEWVLVHELGHVLDHAIRFDRRAPDPVSPYARTNDREAFAEAFTLWVLPEHCAWDGRYDADVLARDKQTLALFEELAR